MACLVPGNLGSRVNGSLCCSHGTWTSYSDGHRSHGGYLFIHCATVPCPRYLATYLATAASHAIICSRRSVPPCTQQTLAQTQYERSPRFQTQMQVVILVLMQSRGLPVMQRATAGREEDKHATNATPCACPHHIEFEHPCQPSPAALPQLQLCLRLQPGSSFLLCPWLLAPRA